jgi:hypothetical protein
MLAKAGIQPSLWTPAFAGVTHEGGCDGFDIK